MVCALTPALLAARLFTYGRIFHFIGSSPTKITIIQAQHRLSINACGLFRNRSAWNAFGDRSFLPSINFAMVHPTFYH